MKGGTSTHKPDCPCPVCQAGRGERAAGTQQLIAFKVSGVVSSQLSAMAEVTGYSPSQMAKEMLLERLHTQERLRLSLTE